ncbi:uncharacterized protein B0H18DRAFT_1084840 [Fomitopsis serialis]|uniref:uncharacterized protein n=1 Tax=Fomitopsis serialis TaxID=139415 RepID=UPI0020087CF1|nr:uncharacterized protein B0H18DRAFT_1084840 [Neoantrodia serialis]KAH9927346.1 hypothetical protein B0H18DRAFT_1084840 [Neoantrodia serialis]
MPEYVYALHEFTPENPDEVSFKIGDKVEVIEKDDLYGDGWWKGRNPAGNIGLFPRSYTSPNPPSISSRLAAVAESADASSASSTVEAPVASTTTACGTSQPPHGTADPILSHSTEELGTANNGAQGSGGGEVMQATMTDVQKAIEQLGRGNDDGSRSFSFMSSRSQSTDHSDAEDEGDKGEEGDETEYGWSKGARTMLAMRAQMENEKREAQGRASSTTGSGTPVRLSGPPHDFEFSDSSEDEDEEQIHPRHLSDHVRSRGMNGRISEEDEEDEETTSKPAFSVVHSRTSTMDFHTPPPVITVSDSSLRKKKSRDSSALIVPSEEFIVPSPSATTPESSTARPEQSTFSQEQLSHHLANEEPIRSPSMNIIAASPVEEVPSPSSQASAPLEDEKSIATSNTPDEVPAPIASHPTSATASPSVISTSPSVQTVSPSPSTVRVAETPQPSFPSTGLPSPTASSFGGSTSTGIRQSLTPATTVSTMSAGGLEAKAPGSGSSGSDTRKERPDGHPSEWSVEQVVEWLRSKGFDEGVCEKFTEQEITGDVLLELDANVLKTEIGIVAFGKRARIVNAIAELRRPPSIFESPSHTPARVTTPRSQTGQSLPYTHSHSASLQSSAHTQTSSGWGYSPMYAPHAYQSSPITASPVAEIPLPSGDGLNRNGWPVAEVDTNGGAAKSEAESQPLGLGLGLAQAIKDGKRPAQLVLSPSDGAIAATAIGGDIRPAVEDDRGAMSESETVASDTKSRGRRLFWRTESGSVKERSSLNDTASRHSKDTSVPQTPPLSAMSLAASSTNSPDGAKSAPEGAPPVTARPKKKRESVDGRKASDRLSLFGTSFSGTLGKSGKSRKPPPSLSGAVEKSEDEKEKHHGTFSRIREKRGSSRPSTADGTSKEKKSGQFLSLKEVKESPDKESEKSQELKDKAKEPERSAVLRKRTASTVGVSQADKTGKADDTLRSPTTPESSPLTLTLKPGQSILEQIGTPDHEGWLRKKGERYNAWKMRYFVLKGPHLYWLRNKSKTESKIKGYINIAGYKVVADENIDPGRYGFRIMHDSEKSHYFSSEEHITVREWMKALMKATITRDYADLVVSSCNIPTIPLAVAQAMNPAPRPPSPGARAATQKAMRPDNPNQLTQRDAQVLLMGVTAKEKGSMERTRLDSFFTSDTRSTTSVEPSVPKTISKVPPRPSREMRRLNSLTESTTSSVDAGLIDWANSHLPKNLQMTDLSAPTYGGLALLRLAEDIKGKQATPRVPDSAFPSGPNDDKLDGLFKLFDFLLDNDVKMGTVSINDIRQGKRDKILQLLKALRAWEDRRKAVAHSLGPPSPPLGSYLAMAGPIGMGPG